MANEIKVGDVDRQIKVGDPVLRQNVSPQALVKSDGGRFIWRRGDEGQVVKVPGDEHWGVDDISWWPWHGYSIEHLTVIALNVPADATADDLRTLAEVFEVREALHAMSPLDALVATGGIGPDAVVYTFDEAAPLLHKAGWRPGMTAELAARLLAEVQQ